MSSHGLIRPGPRASRARIVNTANAKRVGGLAAFVAVLAAASVVAAGVPQLTVSGRQLTWVEWFGVAGVVVTVAALAIAVEQIWRTRTAAEEARSAVRETVRRVARTDLINRLQELRVLDGSFMDPINTKQHQQVIALLARWRDVAAKAVAELEKETPADDELIRDLRESIRVAAQARVIVEEKKKSLQFATSEFRGAMGNVCDRLGLYVERLRLQLEGESS